MHRTRWSGQQWGRGKPFRFRHTVAVAISLGFGGAAAVSATLSTGGCGAQEADSAQGAAGRDCDPNSLPGAGAIDSCLKSNCCEELERCFKDNTCWDCFQGTGTSCSSSSAWGTLATCSKKCGSDADADAGPMLEAEAETGQYRTESTLVLLHASADLWGFRVCLRDENGNWLTSKPLPDDPAAVMPHSNIVGVPPGGALVRRGLENDTSFGTLKLKVYLLDAKAAPQPPSEKLCKELACDTPGAGCLDSDDVKKIDDLMVPMVQGSASVAVFAVNGCYQNSGSVERCGSDYTPGGNLGIRVLPDALIMPDVPSDQGSIRVRTVQMSQSAEALWAAGEAGAGMALTYGDGAGDAGTPLLSQAQFASVAPEATLTVPGLGDADLPAFGAAGFTLSAPAVDGGIGLPLTFSLAQVQAFSSPQDLPPSFWNGSTDFLVALIGDATGAAAPLNLVDGGENPVFDGYGLHVLAVPLQSRTAGDP